MRTMSQIDRSAGDPMDLDGFTCTNCNKELSNAYWHCMGCEWLRCKDTNYCTPCYAAHAHVVNESSAPNEVPAAFEAMAQA